MTESPKVKSFDFFVDKTTPYYQGVATLAKGYFNTLSVLGAANFKACSEAFTAYGDLSESVFNQWITNTQI
jgi:hypothetical protein